MSSARSIRSVSIMMGLLVFCCGLSATASVPTLEIKEVDGIRYLSAGFGLEERAAMPTNFPLKLVFASGRYLLGATDVTVSAGRKKVCAVSSAGPWLLLDLQPGVYTVDAVHNGHKKSASVTVPNKGGATLWMRWKADEVDMGLKE